MSISTIGVVGVFYLKQTRLQALPLLCCTLWSVWGVLEPQPALAEDCNHNGAADSEDIAARTSVDCNRNSVPDECESGFPGKKTTLLAGATPLGVVASDLNGDSRADLATANFDSLNVSVLLGNGDGTFKAQVTMALAGSRLDASYPVDCIGSWILANTACILEKS